MGIDYGRGMTNINHKTGIRFGVIPQHEVLQAWADSSEAVYPEVEDQECPDCDGSGQDPEADAESEGGECDTCGGTGRIDGDDEFLEPMGFEYAQEGYRATCGEDGDIFVIESPFYTLAPFCSPCAPGACYLTSGITPEKAAVDELREQFDGAAAYCFGHDWFEEGRAPYAVYRVDTNELVPPPENP